MKKSKIVIAIISLLSICSFVIGTSVAWLTSKTEDLVNTFTYGDINIKLDETDTNDGDENINTNEYKMLPGNEITKDPKVTVIANSEDSYLFVKLTKSENFDNFMTFEIAEGWTLLEGTTDVYYREVTKSDKDQEFTVLKDNKVKVKEEVTKAMLNELDKEGKKDYPTLTITAYAVQRDGKIEAIDTPAEAWAIASAEEAKQEQANA
jgi:hypothetical protein